MTASDHWAEPLSLQLDVGHPGTRTLDLRVSPAHASELKDALEREGVRTSEVIQLSQGTELVTYAVYVLATAGGLRGLAAALEAFLRRHRDKKLTFQVRNQTVSLEGYSSRSVKKLIDIVVAAQAEVDQQWEELLRGELQGSSNDKDNPMKQNE